MSAHKGLTTATNPAYEIMKQGGGGGQGSHEYELVDAPGTGPPVVQAEAMTYEIPSPPSHQPLTTLPLSVTPLTGGIMGSQGRGGRRCI